MARGKLSMKLTEHDKVRATRMKKRMTGLKKKAYELSILCNVEVCMIIFEPRSKNSDHPAKVEVWPSDPVQVTSIIEKYKRKAASDAQRKAFSVFDFLNLRNRQVRDQVCHARRANSRAKFPTWDDRIDNFSLEQIAIFLTKLDLNLEVVKRKIKSMNGDDQDHKLQSSKARTLGGFNTQSQPNRADNYIPANFRNMQLPSIWNLSPANDDLVKLSISLNPMDDPMKPIDESLRLSMTNDLDFGVGSGIASSCSSMMPNNVMYNPPLISVRHDPKIDVLNNLMSTEPKAAFETCFYAPSMQPEGTYNRQQLMLSCHVFPQMHSSHQFTGFYHDINERELKYKKHRF